MFQNIDPAAALITYLGFLVALTMHEAVVAFAARKLGDRSVETAQRATINPIPHIDLFGTILFPLLMLMSGVNFLIGWAKPFQMDTRYFKNIKKDINKVCFAGLASNISIAALVGLVIVVMGYGPGDLFQGNEPVPRLLQSVATANIVIGLFNIIPFPGRDMWRLIHNNAEFSLAQKMNQYANPISWIMLLLLILGVFTPIFRFAMGVFYSVVFAI